MLPVPDSYSRIDDIYLYYSDYHLLDSYYTIYLECVFAPEKFEAEKQCVIDDAKQFFTLYNCDAFFYDSVYVSQGINHREDGFLAIHISYVLFDAQNHKIIYVDTFEEGIDVAWKTAYIPDKYLPSDLVGFIK